MKLGQIKKVVVIGCGGTGSYLIDVLSRFLENSPDFTGQFWLVDGDKYSADNASRQNFHYKLEGYNKAEAQAAIISQRFPQINERLTYIGEYVGDKNVNSILEEGTVVFNCVDNHVARRLVETRISQLKDAVHICAGNEKVDGQVQYRVRKSGRDMTPTIFNRFPEIQEKMDGDRSQMSCEQLSKLPSGGQIIATNFMAAALMMMYFTSLINFGANKNYFPCDTVRFDVLNASFLREGVIDPKV